MTDSCIPIAVAAFGSLFAALTDVWRFRIYNIQTIPMMASGVIYHTIVSGGEGFFGSACGLMFGIAILLLPFLMGGIGAGDVKLLAAIGAWLGMPMTFYVFIASGCASGICALLMIAFQRSFAEALVHVHLLWLRLSSFITLPNREEWMQPIVPAENQRRRVIPYGAMIAFGIVAAAMLASPHGY